MPLLCTFRGRWRGKVTLKIGDIGNSILREPHGTFDVVFSLGIIPINKCTCLHPSMSVYGGNPHLRPGSNAFWDAVWLSLQSMHHGVKP